MYDKETWEKAKKQAYKVLRERARSRGHRQAIYYSHLTPQITAIPFDPHGRPLAELLGEISREEDAAGRGMLSVLVICKPPADPLPGQGFFDLAEELGRNTADQLACWIKEYKFVLAANQQQ